MRQPVVVSETADLDGRVLAWAVLLERQIFCLTPPKALMRPLYRDAVMGVVSELTKNTNIEPVWPWESDPVAEG